jgi:hypothetical protein
MPPVPSKLIEQAREADRKFKLSRLEFNRAKHERAKAIAKLNGAGMSLRDIATLLGVHFTRVKQLVTEADQPIKRPQVATSKPPRVLVRRANSDVWHWCANCSGYPSKPVAQRVVAIGKRPSGGELCNECRAKEKSGECR